MGAERIGALPAEMNVDVFGKELERTLHDLNPRQGRIGDPLVHQRACQHTGDAAGTFHRVGYDIPL